MEPRGVQTFGTNLAISLKRFEYLAEGRLGDSAVKLHGSRKPMSKKWYFEGTSGDDHIEAWAYRPRRWMRSCVMGGTWGPDIVNLAAEIQPLSGSIEGTVGVDQLLLGIAGRGNGSVFFTDRNDPAGPTDLYFNEGILSGPMVRQSEAMAVLLVLPQLLNFGGDGLIEPVTRITMLGRP